MTKRIKIMMIAGEISGDQHGGQLLEHLREQLPYADYFGIGGPQMLRQGLRAYYTIDDLQVHGLVEVLRHLPELYKILFNLQQAIIEEKPDLLICIDYPGFNLKVANFAKKLGVHVLFFNSPQIWAWREKRIQTIKASVDKIYVLFAFEEKIYQKNGVPVKFCGHPLNQKEVTAEKITQYKSELNLPNDKPCVLLLPGSRPSEVDNHLSVMLGAVAKIQSKHDCHFYTSVGCNVSARVTERIAQYNLNSHQNNSNKVAISIFENYFLKCLNSADVVIVSSGTASLQVGIALKPAMILYRVNKLTFYLAKKLAKIKHVGMVNILSKKEVYKEFLQADMTVNNIAGEALKIIEDSSYKQNMLNDLKEVKKVLGTSDAYKQATDDMASWLNAQLKLNISKKPVALKALKSRYQSYLRPMIVGVCLIALSCFDKVLVKSLQSSLGESYSQIIEQFLTNYSVFLAVIGCFFSLKATLSYLWAKRYYNLLNQSW